MASGPPGSTREPPGKKGRFIDFSIYRLASRDLPRRRPRGKSCHLSISSGGPVDKICAGTPPGEPPPRLLSGLSGGTSRRPVRASSRSPRPAGGSVRWGFGAGRFPVPDPAS